MSADTNDAPEVENIEQVAELDLESGEPTGETYKHVQTLEDIGHPLVPTPDGDYVMRPLDYSDTSDYGPEEDDEDGMTVLDLDYIGWTIQHPDFFTMLIGGTGTGKNAAIKELASENHVPTVRVNFGLGTSYEDLVGSYAPKQDEKGFEFVYGLLAQCVKNGWWFIADEVNAAPPEVMVQLNEVTESMNSRKVTIPETGEVINPHERFRFIATRNPRDYGGRQAVEESFGNRAIPVRLDYLEAEAEKGLLKERSEQAENLSDEQLDSLIDVANDIRSQRAGEMQTEVSPRDLVKVVDATEMMSLREACRAILVDGADPSDRDGIAEIVNTEKQL